MSKKPKLRWQKARNRNLWIVPQFPFFGLVVMFDPYTKKYNGFNTLLEAQKAEEKRVLKNINNYKFSLYHWCNNIGMGKYIHKNQWKKFQWLSCGYSFTSWVSNSPAIRLDADIPHEEAVKIGQKIMDRHKKRYIRIMSENPD